MVTSKFLQVLASEGLTHLKKNLRPFSTKRLTESGDTPRLDPRLGFLSLDPLSNFIRMPLLVETFAEGLDWEFYPRFV